MHVVFFNQPWRERQLTPELHVALYGKVDTYRGGLQMANPVVDLIGDRTGRIVPIYPQSEKAQINTWELAGWVENALERSRNKTPTKQGASSCQQDADAQGADAVPDGVAGGGGGHQAESASTSPVRAPRSSSSTTGSSGDLARRTNAHHPASARTWFASFIAVRNENELEHDGHEAGC